MTAEVWGKNNPLFMYGNEEKLDDLIGRAFGEVSTEIQRSRQMSGGVQAEATAKLGSLLRLIGLGEAEAKIAAKLDTAEAKQIISKQTFELKLLALENYALASDFYPYINVFSGEALQRTSGLVVSQWPAVSLGKEHQVDALGQVLGLFAPVRLVPPHEEGANIAQEYFSNQNTMWLLKSVPDSKIRAEIPIFLKHTRSNSQHATMAFVQGANRLKIECFGLLTWQGGGVVCDPVGWRLFY